MSEVYTIEQDKWATLLSNKTFRETSPKTHYDGRNPFESDYGRLISSSPIRRLQDKTQVFPLEKSDFIRTRLTHSLEVSYIASSLGLSIEKQLIEKKYLKTEHLGYISSLLRVAGLVHDLGNPPFGHFGEEAIRAYFKDFFNEQKNHELLPQKQERDDFIHFDGNVQTFRILRKLQYFKDEHSFNLTYPSLASIIKYPYNSVNGNHGKYAAHVAQKKFGYFKSETADYFIISNYLDLVNKRHPITYLLEAADDIAFSAADIEDGVKLGILNFETIFNVFQNELIQNKGLLDKLKELYNSIHFENEKLFITVQNFRVITQSMMIQAVIECFNLNYTNIMNGDFSQELISASSAADIRSSYKKLQYIIFDNKNIMETELAGWEVIYGLLDVFIPACQSPNFHKEGGNTKEARLYKLISSSFRYIYENYSSDNNLSDNYRKFQLVVDFISGMTDSYALNLYQKLKGISL